MKMVRRVMPGTDILEEILPKFSSSLGSPSIERSGEEADVVCSEVTAASL